jgi:hypothetical protein
MQIFSKRKLIDLLKGTPVTAGDRTARANKRWGSHGHGISRVVAEQELRLKICHLESINGLEGAIRRFWALTSYIYDKSLISKMFLSQTYCIVKNTQKVERQADKVK